MTNRMMNVLIKALAVLLLTEMACGSVDSWKPWSTSPWAPEITRPEAMSSTGAR